MCVYDRRPLCLGHHTDLFLYVQGNTAGTARLPKFGDAPVHCPECDEFSAPPYTTWQVWRTEQTKATAVGKPGKVTRVSPDGKHRVVAKYVWISADPTPQQQLHQLRSAAPGWSSDGKLFQPTVGDVKALDVSHPRLLCACNRPGALSKTTTKATAAGAGAGAGAAC